MLLCNAVFLWLMLLHVFLKLQPMQSLSLLLSSRLHVRVSCCTLQVRHLLLFFCASSSACAAWQPPLYCTCHLAPSPAQQRKLAQLSFCASSLYYIALSTHGRHYIALCHAGCSGRPSFIPLGQAPLLALTVDVARGWQLPVEVFKVEAVAGAGPAAGQPRTYYLVQNDLFR